MLHHRRRPSPLSQPLSFSPTTTLFLTSIPRLLFSLLLLLPLLVTCDIVTESSSLSSFSDSDLGLGSGSGSKDASVEEAVAVPPQARPAVGTKYAPVDGQDGKPHMGAFVEVSALGSGAAGSDIESADAGDGGDYAGAGDESIEGASAAEPTSLKRLSEEMASKDGGDADGAPVSIPESNDGVMDDKNRVGPKQGTTGTEGGVSGKSMSSLEEKVPYAPKEALAAVVAGEDVKVVDVVDEVEVVGEDSGEQGVGIGGLEVC